MFQPTFGGLVVQFIVVLLLGSPLGSPCSLASSLASLLPHLDFWPSSITLALFTCRPRSGHLLLLLGAPLPTHASVGICMSSELAEVVSVLRDLQDQVAELARAVSHLTEVVHRRSNTPPGQSSIAPGSPYRSLDLGTPSSSGEYNALAREIPAIPQAALDLASALRRSDAQQRAERAWNIGYWARFVLAGRLDRPRPSTKSPLPNVVYVVLRAPGFECPLVCTDGGSYRHVVGDFTSETLSHGFASAAEAKIYCAGAGVAYPTSIYQWQSRR